MNSIKGMVIGCLAAASVCIAQTANINISGKVTDTGTTPIAGAAVSLENGGLTATTGADGNFTLTGITGTIDQNIRSLPQGPSATIRNGVLWVNTTGNAALKITVCNLQGQVVASMQKTLIAGRNSLAMNPKGPGIFLYHVKTDKNEFLIKGTSVCGVVRGSPVSFQSPPSVRAMARTAAINDVISVRKSGYLNSRVPVMNSDTNGLVIKLWIILRDTGTVMDIDGNIYHTIKIGNQIWTVENLRVTKYNDGSAIPLLTDTLAWGLNTTPAYCYYNNTTNADSIKKYGALYNWYVVSPANSKKIAPAGWHVPSDAEWDTLRDYLIANGYNWDGTITAYGKPTNKIAKSLAAKTDWVISSNAGAIGNDLSKNNSSGFSALPGGYRVGFGVFADQSLSGFWWSAKATDASYAYGRYLNWDGVPLYLGGNQMNCGLSVRLLRD